jgi:hypothetical protein
MCSLSTTAQPARPRVASSSASQYENRPATAAAAAARASAAVGDAIGNREGRQIVHGGLRRGRRRQPFAQRDDVELA